MASSHCTTCDTGTKSTKNRYFKKKNRRVFLHSATILTYTKPKIPQNPTVTRYFWIERESKGEKEKEKERQLCNSRYHNDFDTILGANDKYIRISLCGNNDIARENFPKQLLQVTQQHVCHHYWSSCWVNQHARTLFIRLNEWKSIACSTHSKIHCHI